MPIRAPILVVGQMRSGTTRMQRLLACDPRLTFTRFYESWNPIPRRVGAPIDGRKLRGRLALATVRLLNPRFRAIHPTRWDAADEEIGLQSLSIFGAAFEAQWRVPRFAALVEHADARPAYHEFRHLLQTLAWLRGGADDRPWVLKVPQFSQDLVALLDVFPDARVVVVRRDAPTVIASAASLVGNQMRIQSDHVDAEWIGREWTRKVRLREDRTTAALAASSAPRVVIDYAEVGADWAREMRRVYAMLGLTLPDPVRTRMQDYVTRTAAGRRPAHVYAPAGLDLAPA